MRPDGYGGGYNPVPKPDPVIVAEGEARLGGNATKWRVVKAYVTSSATSELVIEYESGRDAMNGIIWKRDETSPVSRSIIANLLANRQLTS